MTSDRTSLISNSSSMRRGNNWFLLCTLFALIFWACIFLWSYPLRSSSWMPFCSHLMKENEGVSDTIPVPIRLLLSGEPVALEQDENVIIKYIWANGHLEGPSNKPYNLKKPREDPSRGQAQLVRRILGNMTDGFFVECGALDGETRSNTLFMEQHLNWKGLLVEGDPSNYKLLKQKHRKAWVSNTCLAIKPYPHQATFIQSFNTGRILSKQSEERRNKRSMHTVKVQCFPLFSLLAALNITTIDYFSLDVEGSELKVLKTIPFHKLMIKTLSVEYIHTSEGKKSLNDFMLSKGYKNVGEVHYPNGLANDIIFVHKSVDIKA